MHSVRISAVVAAALIATTAMAAAPVEEARPVQSRVATTPDPDSTDADEPAGIGTLFYQLQILQDEVRRLQGIVEEQNYRIERLVREQRERYIELDQRLLALRPDAAQPPGADDGPDGPTSTAPGAVSVQGDAYNRAYAVVNEARQLPPSERVAEYQRALLMFAGVIRDDPSGEYTPNAYFWMGELYLAMDALEEARQAFAQVTNLYAEHVRVPTSLYKLGVIHHRLGDNDRALQYLDRVTDEYADSAEAGRARAYAAELR